MDLSFGERDAEFEDGPFAVGRDGRGDEDRAIDDASAVTNFLVAGTEAHERCSSQGSIPSGREFLVERRGGLADLHAGYLGAPEFLGDRDRFADRDALHVHIGQSEFSVPFAPLASFQGGGVESDAAGLRNRQSQLAQAAEDDLGPEAIGLVASLGRELVEFGVEDGGPFELHRLVQEILPCRSKAVETFVGKESKHSLKWLDSSSRVMSDLLRWV